MRSSHIQTKIEQQVALSDLISSSFTNLTNIGSENVTLHRLNVRINALRENWEKFSLTHDAIEIALREIQEEDRVSLLSHTYFSENLFSITHESYLDSLERMNSLIDDQRSNSIMSTYTQVPSNAQTCHHQTHQARLPRIDLPKFNGTPSDWLSFKDLFSSLVLDNPTLTSVEKLQYLKTSLVGKATHLLKNTSLTGDNFTKAWESLISFYENKRLLVDAALQSLYDLKRINTESATEMEKLYTDVMQIYRTLETLQRPVTTWDDFLVFTVVRRLDPESIKAWENNLGSQKEPPSWEQLSEFLITRLCSLQAYEKTKSRHKADTRSHAAKSHFQSKSTNSNSNSSIQCILCKANHHISACPQYISKTLQKKLDLITQRRLCYNCLGSHRVACCRVTKRCGKCGKRHHTSIHRTDSTTKKPDETTNPNVKDKSQQSTPIVLHATQNSTLLTPCVLLTTAQVIVTASNGAVSKVRALLDQGSEISLISERLVQRLRVERSHSSIPLVGVGVQQINKTRGIISFKIKPHFDSTFNCIVTAHILQKVTAPIPSVKPAHTNWPHLKGLLLADPAFSTPGSIDLLLGADVYGQLINEELIKGEIDSPIAQSSQLGWIISGPTGTPRLPEEIHSFHVRIQEDLYQLIQRLWELEEVPKFQNSSLSQEEQQCEDIFNSTHSRDVQGRYTVRLPFKLPIEVLGDSKRKAMNVFTSLLRRFSSNAKYQSLYSNFMSEYENLKHMVPVSNYSQEPEQSYYLPHHGVLRESSITTKLRVVFNGSSPTTTGLSLNNLLHTGEKLQTNLFDVLIWFRQFFYVFTSDIEKMFRQINVHSDDWKYQRILWLNKSGEIIPYELTTVTYGLVCAPYLALRTLAQLTKDEGNNFSLAVPVLTYGRYVDDLFGGADTIVQAQQVLQQVNQLCMAGGFPLKKWASNCPEVLSPIPVEDRLSSLSLRIEDNTWVHSLGLSWNTTTDILQFDWNISSLKTITKRNVLSTIAKFFDPLGLLSPIIIKAKIFVQQLWALNLGWDDPLPSITLNKWTNFTDSFQDTHLLKFPRWLGLKSTQSFQLHGFCDASQQAFAAVIYIRILTENERISTQLICSKTKVAPLKRQTIPRLELLSAVLLTKLMSHVLRTLHSDQEQIPVFMWTDSSISYTWINNHPSQWKEFVHNRVCFIQETLPQSKWKFVPGSENPADIATRGLTPRQLIELTQWWYGPHWLSQSEETWPQDIHSIPKNVNLEERATNVSVNVKSKEPWNLLHRYSSLTKLIRITAICQRVIACFRKIPNSSLLTPLTTEKISKSEEFWTRTVQRFSFHHEIQLLLKKEVLPKSNSLVRLTPFIDSNGILRVGGRLQASQLASTTKHPAILPKDSPFSTLIILNAHQKMLHGGVQITLSYIRNQYWILGGRTIVRSHIFKCIKCTRFRQQRAQQLMGQLPPEKLTPSRPFLNSGIDYAGPILLKTWKGKNARTYKAYIALFVCHSTSAVHIELVTDYSADTFIAAFKRFTARRGICSTLMSDCGTTLKGADAELRRLFSASSKESEQLANLLAKDGTQWKFIPPAAPHFGGKWEAGVKSVKYHLKRVIGDALLTYEEMSTLLTQIEAVLNSRPLCPLTEDPEDLDVLTPGHFIMGCAPSVIPEPSLQEIRSTRLSRWQLIRQMLECFWTRWSTECLQRYLSIYKWNQVTPSLTIGSMVLVVDERYPPSKWPLGRVIKTHPGKDDLTRVVTVRTQNSELKRPIVKLCPLPISVDTM